MEAKRQTVVQRTVKNKAVGFKVTPEQYQALGQRAARCGVPLGLWMRSILLQAAAQKPHKGHLRIREPDGAVT
jgi:hypothetical protein